MKFLLLITLLTSFLFSDEKREFTPDETKTFVVADYILKNYSQLTEEIEFSKKNKLNIHRLYKDYYSFDFIAKYQKDVNNTEEKVLCFDDFLYDYPVKECLFFKDFKYKDVNIKRLVSVEVTFVTPLKKDLNFIKNLTNPSDITVETIINIANKEENIEFNYQYEKKPLLDVDNIRNSLYKKVFDLKAPFIIAENYLEVRNKEEFYKDVKKMKNKEDLLHLSENYNRYIEKIVDCKEEECNVILSFKVNNQKEFIINYFYEINSKEEMLNVLFKSSNLKDLANEAKKNNKTKNRYDF